MTALRTADQDVSAPSLDDDWYLWRAEGNACARTRLIEKYMPFAKMLSAKVFAKRVLREAEFDDYKHWGIEGLIEAVDRFDPSVGGSFETFASKRIQGAILNQVDTLSDKAAQISMRARIRRERLQSVTEPLQLGVDTSTLFDRLAEVAVGLALGLLLEDTGMIQQADESFVTRDVYCSIELGQLRERIHALVELLPDRERTLIKYHYYFSYSFTQIAEEFGLTRGRISQLHRQALNRMRALQNDSPSLDLLI